jgi:cytosine/adenosine deaminase-related metal-dependent hydrolase
VFLRADHVLTLTGPPLSPGWVEVESGRVVRTGAGVPPGPATDLGAHVLLPGLINSHCHLDYTHFAGQLSPGRSFSDWVAQINALKRSSTLADYRDALVAGFAESVNAGTTTLVNIESYPDAIVPAPIRTWWAIEGIDVGGPFFIPKLPPLAAVSPHAPFTASPGLYRRMKRIAEKHGALFTTHVGESTDEHEMFFKASGGLYAFLDRLGRDMSDCGHGTSLGYLLDEVLLPAHSLLVHVNNYASSDLARLVPEGHAVVHCPQTHAYFGRRVFDAGAFQKRGIPLFLGTDSRASSGSLSLFDEMRTFRAAHPDVAASDLLAMVTSAPGAWLMPGTGLGTLAANAPADLIAVPVTGNDPFDSVLAHPGPVPWVMSDGHWLRRP